MVKFINKHTGSPMYVAEDRVEEYKSAGHKLAKESKPKKAAGTAAKKGNSKK